MTEKTVPWFEQPAVVAVSVLCCWPVGLVLLLRHPRAPQWAKILVAGWIALSVLIGIGAVINFMGNP